MHRLKGVSLTHTRNGVLGAKEIRVLGTFRVYTFTSGAACDSLTKLFC